MGPLGLPYFIARGILQKADFSTVINIEMCNRCYPYRYLGPLMEMERFPSRIYKRDIMHVFVLLMLHGPMKVMFLTI